MTIGRGTVLNGRYLVADQLGGGGFGTVWRCRDGTLRRDVAIKVLHWGDSPESLERFQREAVILARLSHPGITTVHDIGSHEGQPFIVMELLKGDELGKILASNPSGLPVSSVLDLATQIAEALAVAHESGVVHRDLKPSNLLVLPGNRTKICDFGISKAIDVTRTLTVPGQVIGTPTYMSPEQFAGQADARSDLYSLGCVLYAMLTGHPPFRGDSWQMLAYQHVNVSPELPRGLEAIPEPLSTLVLRLLAKRPQDRPSTASDVRSELRQISLPPRKPSRPRPRYPTPQTTLPYTAAPQPLVDDAKARQDAARLASELADQAAAELEAMDPQQAALTLSHFRSPALLSNVLDRMKPGAVAALLAHLPARKSATLVANMDQGRAARIMDVMPSALAATILQHMASGSFASVLTAMAPARAAAALTHMTPGHVVSRLGNAEDHVIAAILEAMEPRPAIAMLAAMPEFRRSMVGSSSSLRSLLAEADARYKDHMSRLVPWRISFSVSGFLLAATTFVLAIGVFVDWVSWPWIFVLIPAAILSAFGATAAAHQVFERKDRLVAGIAANLVSGLAFILLATSLPHIVTVPVAVIGAITGAILADAADYLDEIY